MSIHTVDYLDDVQLCFMALPNLLYSMLNLYQPVGYQLCRYG